MPPKEDALANLRCDMIFNCAEEMGSINMYRDEVFAEKKAEYVGGAAKQIACIQKRLEESSGPFFFGVTPYYCDFAVPHMEQYPTRRTFAAGRHSINCRFMIWLVFQLDLFVFYLFRYFQRRGDAS